MELRHLRYFVAVAEELHFGHAALRLHTSQPSLSQQIQDLERELKVALLARTRRRVSLTPAGDRFLREARAILAAADRAAGIAREAERGESGALVLGISAETDWQVLGPALRVFTGHVPSARVSFQNLTPEEQLAALSERQIDVGFVGLPIDASGLVTESIARVRLVAALPENHPVARKKTIRLEELSGEPYVLWPRHFSPGLYDQLFAAFARAGFGPPIAMEGGLPSTRTVLGMVAAGLAIALVEPVTEHVGTPGVVCRPLAHPGVSIEKGVVYRSEEPSPVVASFLNEVRVMKANGDRRRSRGRKEPWRTSPANGAPARRAGSPRGSVLPVV
ncbi:MAG TPA: LysR substrate-binding domain-containing protein [Thermoanaerobaculia bacterium]